MYSSSQLMHLCFIYPYFIFPQFNAFSIKWSEKQAENMLNVKHRHAVFTIPEELRNYFYKKRELLKELQDAVYGVRY